MVGQACSDEQNEAAEPCLGRARSAHRLVEKVSEVKREYTRYSACFWHDLLLLRQHVEQDIMLCWSDISFPKSFWQRDGREQV